ncbi:hypothetical protein S7711_01667 [Stachybotrys chartarum IBT 7711]|uniref:Prenyltransferase alpha-alpha toroid domain-containing protein n=1 Tax=Stachybotrys chartarum (strain CBS 109288 / IBT 7711) TaxID=1280523 RepID=A0A084AV82_STACB|nr:hypothetical protein S7711_01667 [Stachybotrys chartarum IBT 7711]
MASSEPSLKTEKHVKYWKRCHSTFLPSNYTSGDSTRLTLGSFIICALDLLSVPFEKESRRSIREWVLALQHPDGGFCGSPTHSLPGWQAGQGTANLAATYFALVLLGAVAEPGAEQLAFARVRRASLLRWLRKLQRADGSFGQNLWDGEPTGGKDMRHSYLASCIRWMLRGWENPKQDVDVDRMTYDGGFAESWQNESHAGYVYCAVAALAMLDRQTNASPDDASSAISRGIQDRPGLTKFLAFRQFAYAAEQEERENHNDDSNFVETKLGSLTLEEEGRCAHVGFNGRWNKKADTCYCWWVAGTLTLLGQQDLVNKTPSRRFILEITQHQIGGFSKAAGGPPDIFHSYLGLASLAAMKGGEPGLKDFDAGLCCSKNIATTVERAGKYLWDECVGEAALNNKKSGTE